MSRQKENRALPSQTRANGSIFGSHVSLSGVGSGGGGGGGGGGDFFTDSLLDDTLSSAASARSRIPSPTSKKTRPSSVAANPRRALHSAAPVTASTTTAATTLPPIKTRPLHISRHSVNSVQRKPQAPVTYSYHKNNSSSNNNSNNAIKSDRPSQYSPSAWSPSTRPARAMTMTAATATATAATTPPHSANSTGPDEFRTSLNSNLSTPPKALTEVYQRIDDEQALAAAEREDRSSEGGGSDRHTGAFDIDVDSAVAMSPGRVGSQLTGPVSEGTGTGTGMSFLNGLTDPNIANSITPAVSSHVKDMRKLGISTKPIVFNPAMKPSERLADSDTGYDEDGDGKDEVDVNDDDYERIGDWSRSLPLLAATEPKKLFPLSGRLNRSLNSRPEADKPGISVDEGTGSTSRVFQCPSFSPPRQMANLNQTQNQSQHQQQQQHELDRDEDDGDSTDDDLRKREVLFKFSQFAKKLANSKSSQAGSDESGGGRHTPRAEEAEQAQKDGKDGKAEKSDKAETKTKPNNEEEQGQNHQSENSSVNWEAVDQDTPLPSIEGVIGGSSGGQNVTGPLKRWDNDFTGVSFQVSESPPVKSKGKDKTEIQPEEEAEQQQQQQAKPKSDAKSEIDGLGEGEPIPDTPVVIFRSSTSSQTGKQEEKEGGEEKRPSRSTSRSTSLDLMHRLARLGSSSRNSTSRTSTSSTSTSNTSSTPKQGRDSSEVVIKGEATEEKPSAVAAADAVADAVAVAATPKVTGAWTDTILPSIDTVKTVKQDKAKANAKPKYEQTPLVKAGGWVDSPSTGAGTVTGTGRMQVIEDVTEELDTDVGPMLPSQPDAKPESEPVREKADVEAEAEPESNTAGGGGASTAVATVPKSAWASIRDRQRQQHQHQQQQQREGSKDNTLILGNDTLASLDSVLDRTSQDLLKLSSAGLSPVTGVDADTTRQLELMLLGSLQTLQSDIYTTRQGISQLEQEASRDVGSLTTTNSYSITGVGAGMSAGTAEAQEKAKVLVELIARLTGGAPSPSSALTTTTATTTSTTTSKNAKTRTKTWTSTRPATHLTLTVLFVAVFCCCWYLLECTLAEMLSHPVVAERYSWPSHSSPALAFPPAPGGSVPGGSRPVSELQILPPPTGLIIPSLLLRWLASNPLTATMTSLLQSLVSGFVTVASMAFTLLRAAYRALAIALGWTDGFVEPSSFLLLNPDGTTSSGTSAIAESIAESIAKSIANAATTAASTDVPVVAGAATTTTTIASSFFGMDHDEFM